MTSWAEDERVVHLNGRWRIVEMDLWDQDAIDLVEPGFIEFGHDGTGEFGFIVVRGWMDCRPGEHSGRDSVEFSWQGHDEGDEVSGRGWAVLADDGSLQGHLYFHLGNDSGFRAVRVGQDSEIAPSAQQLDELDVPPGGRATGA